MLRRCCSRRTREFFIVGLVSAMLMAGSAFAPLIVHAGCGADGGPPVPPPPSPPPPVPPQLIPSIGTGASELYKSAQLPMNYATQYPSVVSWAYSLEDALQAARQRNEPYAIYFCTEPIGKVTGEGPEVLAEYKKKNDGKSPNRTPFDTPGVVGWFYASQMQIYVKIPVNADNKAIVEKYKAFADMLMICAPDGEKLLTLSGFDCNDNNVVNFLRNEFKQKWEAWKTRAAARRELDAKTVGIEAISDNRLTLAYRLNKRLITGGQPEGEEAYKALKELGVRTIVSVEGLPSNAELAAKYGMRSVHVPIGYNGVSEQSARTLAKLVRDLPGPVYMHCRCGLNRSAAAGAAACVVLGEMTTKDALAAMKTIGTEEYFRELIDSAANAKPASKEVLDNTPAKFEASVEVNETIKTMNEIGRLWKKLDKARRSNFTDPEGKDEAVQMLLKFTAMSFSEETQQYGAGYQKLLKESEAATKDFTERLATRKKNAPADGGMAELGRAYNRISASCTACHAAYRDHVSTEKKK